MIQNQMIEEINKLKEKRKAVVLAHLYQNDEIQEIADFTGDSLELSKMAADTDADTIVFCGVKFMGETAKILSPEKAVLLPAPKAGCLLADMITGDMVLSIKEEYPGAAVVCYVNSSAEVKAVSDYCCTSSNAVKLVRNIPENEIIFIPDKNLGSYVAEQVPEKRILLWSGHCPIHDQVTEIDIKNAQDNYPQVPILVHPECRPEVCQKADFVGSTSAILKYVRESNFPTYIIGTEKGILYRLQKENPQKSFIMLSPNLLCSDMKLTTIADVYDVLFNMKNEITIDNKTRVKAINALNNMLKYS